MTSPGTQKQCLVLEPYRTQTQLGVGTPRDRSIDFRRCRQEAAPNHPASGDQKSLVVEEYTRVLTGYSPLLRVPLPFRPSRTGRKKTRKFVLPYNSIIFLPLRPFTILPFGHKSRIHSPWKLSLLVRCSQRARMHHIRSLLLHPTVLPSPHLE